jgi:hypothetical protein
MPRLAGWRAGGLAGWRAGGLAGWRAGGTGPGPQQLNVKSVEVGGCPAKHVRLLSR